MLLLEMGVEETERSPGPCFPNCFLACSDSGPICAPEVLFACWRLSQPSVEAARREELVFENSLMENICLPWREGFPCLAGQCWLSPLCPLTSRARGCGLALQGHLPLLDNSRRCGKPGRERPGRARMELRSRRGRRRTMSSWPQAKLLVNTHRRVPLVRVVACEELSTFLVLSGTDLLR